MFRKNEAHKQQRMFTVIDQLPESAREKLENSWAQVFYKEYFSRLDESVFSPLYSERKSRPNTPVNLLVGFETLKSGFGLSDERLYEHFLFDLKFRYALGLHDFDEGHFELRTIYNFRRALVDYEAEHGVNLIREATERITDEQLERFELKTGLQRMDSTMVQSNIRRMSRLQLVVEIIRRLYRMLGEEEREAYSELFGPYMKEDSLHYCYRVERDDLADRTEQVGRDLASLIEGLAGAYTGEQEYEHARRVFEEHFRLSEGSVEVRASAELDGSTLQSPDDPEATFRTKSGESSRGYVANITETCDEENKLQLITSVSVRPNTTDDQKLLASDLEHMKERVDVKELLTDAGYAGADAAKACEKHTVTQKVSAIKGRKKKGDTFGLEQFIITRDEQGMPVSVSCPNGLEGEVRKREKSGRYTVGFDAGICESCPFAASCPTKPLKKKHLRVLRFSDDDLRVAAQRKQVAESGGEVLNKRASVESTVRSVIHPFGGHRCKVPVRGNARTTSMMVLSAAMVNIRRIAGYLCPQNPPGVPVASCTG
jgi:hypothetical protein